MIDLQAAKHKSDGGDDSALTMENSVIFARVIGSLDATILPGVDEESDEAWGESYISSEPSEE